MNIISQLAGTFSVQKPGEVNDTIPLSFNDSSLATERFDTEYTLTSSEANKQVDKAVMSVIRHVCVIADDDIELKFNSVGDTGRLSRIWVVMNASFSDIFITNPHTDKSVKVRVIIAGN